MTKAQPARIHPTAVISPEAELADDVTVGPHVVIEGPVRIGPQCTIRAHAYLCGPLTMGAGNAVYQGAYSAKDRSTSNTTVSRRAWRSATAISFAST